MVTGGAMLALAACGGAGEPRRQESYAELKARQDREFAASPDIQLPEVRRRLRAMGVADSATLPESVEETHVSLFDGSNCGIEIKGKKAFGVQYHPEASPGPQDSFYLFEKFVGMLG
jgi:GMP synthase-like glutamine amidotransferase